MMRRRYKMAESNKKISKQALKKSFRNWYYGHLTCFSQEHMQTFGYLCSMLPIIEDLYDTKEEQKEALETYTAFFNTEPQLGTVVVGITAGLEEARANGDDNIDGEMINGIRAGLMGPVAGIGDSLVVGTLIPILLGIALGLSTNGSPLGAIFYIVVWNLVITLGMRFLYYKGYELGGKAVEIIVGEKANAIRESVIMLGTIVIGAVAASWISVTTSFKMFNSEGGIIIDLQNVCDGIFPKLLPLLTVIFCWFLMSKKKMSPTKVMLILVVIAFIGVLVGFFNPGLQY
ncbi:PTS system, mannose/fructose/sorbose IID component [Clostridium neonatale]|nr:PTS system, mannose/fructose/sorbose IID component [Clostridium neonatale]CAI3719284.1 PTS system, mannose/fructose/sorbose IID component [Clostridium neonatale]